MNTAITEEAKLNETLLEFGTVLPDLLTQWLRQHEWTVYEVRSEELPAPLLVTGDGDRPLRIFVRAAGRETEADNASAGSFCAESGKDRSPDMQDVWEVRFTLRQPDCVGTGCVRIRGNSPAKEPGRGGFHRESGECQLKGKQFRSKVQGMGQ